MSLSKLVAEAREHEDDLPRAAGLLLRVARGNPGTETRMRWWEAVGALERRHGEDSVKGAFREANKKKLI